MPSRTDPVRQAADRLAAAARTGTPCPPVRDLLGPDDLDAAYRVQSAALDEALATGRRRVGRKIGLTSPAVQAQLGVDQPDFGSLLDDMQVDPGGSVPAGRLLQPKVEAEVAFVLSADLTGPLPDEQALLPGIAGARVAVEIVDSRIAGWDITIVDTIADNASSGMFVLGAEEVDPASLDLTAVQMQLWVNGTERSTGVGRACLGGPLTALLWLARRAQELGDPLRAGEVVLSGALGPMVPAAPGDVVTARVTGLGEIGFAFATEESS